MTEDQEHRLKLSVIVVSFKMARELPRTIRTLSPATQKDIGAEDYEIIVIDNGSPNPPSPEEVEAWSPNARLVIMDNPDPSPVAAINLALSMARGELIGVCIDGARMATPGLLARALEAASVHENPVIGTLAFHIGPDVQMRSVAAGYNQATEDQLLAACGWEEDPYNLFKISVFAGSSAQGWFVVPAETNALFLTAAQWRRLGGYDPGFVLPGGGLANLDIWARACGDPTGKVIMLLGEATFHQVHGGVATNSTTSKWDQFHAEYIGLRGHAYRTPTPDALFWGRLNPAALSSLEQSVAKLKSPAANPMRIRGRKCDTDIPTATLDTIQSGVMRSAYRGVPFFKSPFDIGLYLQLMSRLRPATVIEIGCKFGGSALWFADMLSAQGMDQCSVVSIDIKPLADFTDPRIRILTGDAADLGAVLTPELLSTCARPWLVIEDSSHFYEHTAAALAFFDDHLEPGDYIVVEDGIVGSLSDPHYATYQNGPSRALADFLDRRGDRYEIDTDLCDFYGRNATYNPNGWLKRL